MTVREFNEKARRSAVPLRAVAEGGMVRVLTMIDSEFLAVIDPEDAEPLLDLVERVCAGIRPQAPFERERVARAMIRAFELGEAAGTRVYGGRA